MPNPARQLRSRSLLVAAVLGVSGTAHAQFLGPSPYQCQDDSPWPVAGPDFFLETFEDGALNTPGVTGGGSIAGPGGIVDSVDCDDGILDGFGEGRSYFGSGNPGLTFTFNGAPFGGQLPQRVGIVWTDGVHNSTPNSVRFEAFGPDGTRLGEITGTHADSSVDSETAEDRFYGIEHAPGISRIRIYQTAGCCGIEVDHLQYGLIGCRADFNADGFLDFFDYDEYVACFEGSGSPGCDADFNNDGFADFFDYDDFVEAFEAGC
jgi:hypothetical protein